MPYGSLYGLGGDCRLEGWRDRLGGCCGLDFLAELAEYGKLYIYEANRLLSCNFGFVCGQEGCIYAVKNK